MPRCSSPRDLPEVLAATWRAFTWDELSAIASDFAARQALQSGQIVRVVPGLYAHTSAARSYWTRADAVSRWLGTRGTLAGETALFIAGVLSEPPHILTVVVPRHQRIAHAPRWLRVTYASYAPRVDFVDSWEIVEPCMALAQCFGRLDHGIRAGTFYAALAQGSIRVEGVRRALAVMPRVKDRPILKQYLEDAEDGVESSLEYDAKHDVLNLPEFAALVRQFDIVAGGRRYRLDLYHPELRIAVELDGAAFHATQGHWQRDLNRDAALLAQGVVTVRFSYWDVTERPNWCREVLRAVIAQRSRGGALAVEK
ncbi:DUF559 domain-containing protein [Demequina globuliformis]|uniref:DUF559 domain-containing protein n=1 Tax=Demequina globuliformis TaxID=676202 RepID=UPI0009FDB2BF|nr:DUF559 domain-containing protein [Demequina globuliformis]